MDAASDLGRALRRLRRSPSYVALTLAMTLVGMAPVITVAALVYAVYGRPPRGIATPSQVNRLYAEGTPEQGTERGSVTPRLPYPVFLAIRSLPPYEKRLAAYTTVLTIVSRGAETRPARAALVSEGFFRVLQAADLPFAGALPQMTEADAQVVLSYDYWRRALEGDSALIGSDLRVGDRFYRVAAVAAPGFVGADEEPTDLWLPLRDAPDGALPSDFLGNWFSPSAQVLFRGGSGEQPSQVERVVSTAAGETGSFKGRVILAPLNERQGPMYARERARLALVMAVAVVVWVAVGFSLVNVMLARLLAQLKAIRIRIALGATWGRIATEFVSEAVLVAAGAAALALATAFLCLGPVMNLVFPTQQWAPRLGDILVGAAASAALIGTVCLFATATLVLMARWQGGILTGDERATASRVAMRGRLILIALQTTVTCAAGLSAFAAASSFAKVRGINTGIDLRQTFVADLRAKLYGGTTAEEERIEHLVVSEPLAVPGARMAMASSIPFSFSAAWWFTVPGGATQAFTSTYVTRVSEGFFDAIGQRVVAGRSFTRAEGDHDQRIMIANETLARAVWPGQDPVGRCIYLGGPAQPCLRVIGVVEDAKREMLIAPPEPHAYVPLSSSLPRLPIIALLGRGDRSDYNLVPELRGALLAIGAREGATRIFRLAELVEPELRPWKVSALALAALGAVSLMVTLVGVYGIVAYTTAQRKREVAIRTAFGAMPFDVAVTLLKPVGMALGGGVVGGIIILELVAPRITPILYQTQPVSLVSIGLLSAAMATGLALALVSPLWRVLHLDVRSSLEP